MSNALTYGLTHVAFAVKDIERSVKFYQQIFDVQIMYKQEEFAQVTTPGTHDIIVFEKKQNHSPGKTGELPTLDSG